MLRRLREGCDIPLQRPCSVDGQVQKYAGQVPGLSWLVAPPPLGSLYNASSAPAYNSMRKVRPVIFRTS